MTVVSISSILDCEARSRTGQMLVSDEPVTTGLSAADRSMHVVQKFAALGEMTGGITHDFGNILAVIDASLRLAERNLDQPEELQTYIAGARDAIRRGSKLTSQLMAFARRPELEVYGGDVNEYLSSLEPLLRFSAGPLNPVFFEFHENLPKCLINRTQFDVALINLLNNARDASAEGRAIRITTAMCQGEFHSYVRVRVEDYGSGMSAEVLNRVFDPFFTTKGEQGSGLGLPQIHAAMKLVGGYVSVTSELGRGTAVDLMFPTASYSEISFKTDNGLELGA